MSPFCFGSDIDAAIKMISYLLARTTMSLPNISLIHFDPENYFGNKNARSVQYLD